MGSRCAGTMDGKFPFGDPKKWTKHWNSLKAGLNELKSVLVDDDDDQNEGPSLFNSSLTTVFAAMGKDLKDAAVAATKTLEDLVGDEREQPTRTPSPSAAQRESAREMWTAVPSSLLQTEASFRAQPDKNDEASPEEQYNNDSKPEGDKKSLEVVDDAKNEDVTKVDLQSPTNLSEVPPEEDGDDDDEDDEDGKSITLVEVKQGQHAAVATIEGDFDDL